MGEKRRRRSAMYRLIACDLDETLLDDNGDVPPRVRDAVTAARARIVR